MVYGAAFKLVEDVPRITLQAIGARETQYPHRFSMDDWSKWMVAPGYEYKLPDALIELSNQNAWWAQDFQSATFNTPPLDVSRSKLPRCHS